MSTYRIREVDGGEDREDLEELHRLTLLDTPLVDFEEGHWWIAYRGPDTAAFAGLHPVKNAPGRGYLVRSGVLTHHRGQGLQKRLIRARVRKARSLGWSSVVTDTRFNPASANSLIACGFRIFSPDKPWAFADSIYWKLNTKGQS